MNSETTSPGSDSLFTAELFVRSLAPRGAHDCQQAVIDRLDRLQQNGQIESVTCTVWGDRICPETASRVTDGQKALRDIARLRRWTSKHSVSLTPFFEEREVEPIEEEPYTVIVPPILCLAISRDDELWGVFPCDKDGESLSAMDGLDALAEETLPEAFADRTPLQS
jgi:hypothetical protein